MYKIDCITSAPGSYFNFVPVSRSGKGGNMPCMGSLKSDDKTWLERLKVFTLLFQPRDMQKVNLSVECFRCRYETDYL